MQETPWWARVLIAVLIIMLFGLAGGAMYVDYKTDPLVQLQHEPCK